MTPTAWFTLGALAALAILATRRRPAPVTPRTWTLDEILTDLKRTNAPHDPHSTPRRPSNPGSGA